jgi:hypothetical protein
MLIAFRPGQEVLIPDDHRDLFRRQGWQFRDAPSDLTPVSAPMPLAEAMAQRAASAALKKRRRAKGAD